MTGGGGTGRPGKAGRGLAFSKPNATTLRVGYDDGTGQVDFTVAGLNPRGAWAATTAYAVNDFFTNAGSSYRVTTAHTSPAVFAFDSAKMEVQAAAGTNGTGLNPRGAWAATTTYALNDLFTNAGSTYRVTAAYTSPAGAFAYDGTKMEVYAAAGAAAPDPLIYSGLTGGRTGCLCYLSGAGTVRIVDRAMLGKLRDNIPLFFKHPDGTYRLISLGNITGLSGLTAPYVMTLKQPTGPTDTNVTYYDRNGTGYDTYKASAFQAYLEPGTVLNATTVIANMIQTSVRFFDTSGLTFSTIKDTIATSGTFAYTNNAAIPVGIWNYILGAPAGGTYRFTSADTTLAPNGAIAEMNNSGNTLFFAAHAGVTDFADGGCQGVVSKGDGAVQPFWMLNRMKGTTPATAIGVGAQANQSATVANRSFTVGYFNNGVWTDCTDPEVGPQAAPTLAGSVGFRMLVDTIGTFVGAKIWPTNSAEPADYTVWGWQNVVSAVGGTGVADNYGRLWVGEFTAYWGAPGSAPRGP